MPKRIVPLTDLQLKTAKPKVKEYKLSDGGGLHLLITPSGAKYQKGHFSSEKWPFFFGSHCLNLQSYQRVSCSFMTVPPHVKVEFE